MSGDEPEGFLGRWSRVKRTATRAQPEPPEEPTQAPDADAGADAEASAAPEAGAEAKAAADAQPATLSDEELAALPRIEDLVPGSDIRPFLRPGVPRALKNAAMRRMWMLTPVIRDHQDPAVDYAWDWNTPGGVPGDGVAPSPERAAQMLKSLLSPRRDAPATDAAGEGADAAPEPQPDAAQTGDAPADAPPDSGLSAPDRVAADPAPDTPPEPGSDPDPLPRRRHGSALPG